MISKWDLSNVEIQTKSVEQALIPLVTQITTLVKQREMTHISDKAKVALYNIGSVLQRAIRSFGAVAIEMAKENDDLVQDMNEACEEAMLAGDSIASLINLSIVNFIEKSPLVEASRSLLAAITRVLLLIDVIAVRKLLFSVQKVDMRLKELENVHNFTEFVQCFSHFGADMVELAHVSGDRQNDLKDEKQRAEVCAARALLEKSTMMLLTTCKTCLRHPESPVASGNRNGVFTNMRNAMNLMTVVVETNKVPERDRQRSLGLQLDDFEVIIDVALKDSKHPDTIERLDSCADAIVMTTKGLLDLQCIRSSSKESIELCCVTFASLKDKWRQQTELGDAVVVEVLLEKLSAAASNLKEELMQAAVAEVTRMLSYVNCKRTLHKIRSASLAGSLENVNKSAALMKQDVELLKEVSAMVCSIGVDEPAIITARKIGENVESFLAQLIVSAQILSGHPSSKITLENMDVFADVWMAQIEELKTLLCSIVHLERSTISIEERSSRDLDSALSNGHHIGIIEEEACTTVTSRSVATEMDWDSYQPLPAEEQSVSSCQAVRGDESQVNEDDSARSEYLPPLSSNLVESNSLSSLLDGVQTQIAKEIRAITKAKDVTSDGVPIWRNCLENHYITFLVVKPQVQSINKHDKAVSVLFKDGGPCQIGSKTNVTFLKNSPFDNSWLHQDVAGVAADVIQTAQHIIDNASKLPLEVTFEHVEMLRSSADEVHRTLNQIISKDLTGDDQRLAMAMDSSFAEQLKNVGFSSASSASGHNAALIKLSSVIKQVVVMCTFLYRLMEFMFSSLDKEYLWNIENALFSSGTKGLAS